MQIVYYFIVLVVLVIPALAEAAGAPRTLRELSELIVDLIGAATVTATIAAFVIYLWGIVYDFSKLRDNEAGAFKQYYFWGIAILFVMSSIWGILQLVQNTVFSGDVPGGGSQAAPCTDFADCQSVGI